MSKLIIFNERDGSEFEQNAEDTILRAALRSGLGMSYECNSGGCGSCKIEIVDGEIQTLWPDAPGLTDRDRKRQRHLACQCRAIGPLTIAVSTAPKYVPKITPQRQRARLIETSEITHDIREFRFLANDNASFLPGQYAMLDLPGLKGSRAYSVSNTPNTLREWHFLIRRVSHGLGTRKLFEDMTIGDEIDLDGPYGMAFLQADSPRPIVCVAGGSGLAPMISIARGAFETGLLANRKLYFFYGARTPKDICGEEILRKFDGFGATVMFYSVVSHPGEGEEWYGPTGFVHDFVAKVLPQKMVDYEFYFAGPPPMVQAMQEMLVLGHHVPFGQIHFDQFY